ncbi:MAG: RES family NAD+ phosphorylase [Acidiferrobacterales bacterium]
MELKNIPLSRERWKNTARIVSSRFPPVGLFDRVADPADLEIVYYIEGLTNPRLRAEAGDLRLVEPADRLSGPGTTPVMAAFAHPNPAGSRFSDGSFGVYYCARSVETAIHETRYHRERFLQYSAETPIMLEMRVYYADIRKSLHDLRAAGKKRPLWLDPESYVVSRKLGHALKGNHSYGVLYPSVRHAGGECGAVLRPSALSPARQGEHYGYYWDGHRITNVAKIVPVL